MIAVGAKVHRPDRVSRPSVPAPIPPAGPKWFNPKPRGRITVNEMERAVAIEELQRVAALLDARFLSRSTFEKHATISSATIEATFGSWNEAIVAAGLVPLPPGGLPKAERRRVERLARQSISSPLQGISDEDLLDDLVRLADELGRRPSGNQVTAKGKFSREAYQKRWGSISRAYDAARTRGTST